MMRSSEFDPEAKELELRAESSNWDVSNPVPADPGDIPVIDISAWIASGDDVDLAAVAAQVNDACETAGFFQLVGHTVSRELIDEVFDMTERFHALPLKVKESLRMDREGWPVAGVGYLPMYSRKLPTREKANLNEAFLVKGNRELDFDESQWPGDDALPRFRDTVERYAGAVNRLALRLLPVYATALGLEAELPASLTRQRIELGLAAQLGEAPLGLDPALGLETLRSEDLERAGPDALGSGL